jgi:F-type H+-transporting ATPase subunit delta
MPAKTSGTAIAKIYFRALLETGRARNALEAFERDIADLDDLLRAVPELESYLKSPEVPAERKRDICLRALSSAREEIRNLAILLVEKNRCSLIPEIRRQFSAALREMEGRVEAEVISAVELTPDARARLLAALERRLGRKVDLRVRTDPAILGGIIVVTGDRVFDDSIRSRMEAVRRLMMEAKLRARIFAEESAPSSGPEGGGGVGAAGGA